MSWSVWTRRDGNGALAALPAAEARELLKKQFTGAAEVCAWIPAEREHVEKAAELVDAALASADPAVGVTVQANGSCSLPAAGAPLQSGGFSINVVIGVPLEVEVGAT